jgi:hypothetical protein
MRILDAAAIFPRIGCCEQYEHRNDAIVSERRTKCANLKLATLCTLKLHEVGRLMAGKISESIQEGYSRSVGRKLVWSIHSSAATK